MVREEAAATAVANPGAPPAEDPADQLAELQLEEQRQEIRKRQSAQSAAALRQQIAAQKVIDDERAPIETGFGQARANLARDLRQLDELAASIVDERTSELTDAQKADIDGLLLALRQTGTDEDAKVQAAERRLAQARQALETRTTEQRTKQQEYDSWKNRSTELKRRLTALQQKAAASDKAEQKDEVAAAYLAAREVQEALKLPFDQEGVEVPTAADFAAALQAKASALRDQFAQVGAAKKNLEAALADRDVAIKDRDYALARKEREVARRLKEIQEDSGGGGGGAGGAGGGAAASTQPRASVRGKRSGGGRGEAPPPTERSGGGGPTESGEPRGSSA